MKKRKTSLFLTIVLIAVLVFSNVVSAAGNEPGGSFGYESGSAARYESGGSFDYGAANLLEEKPEVTEADTTEPETTESAESESTTDSETTESAESESTTEPETTESAESESPKETETTESAESTEAPETSESSKETETEHTEHTWESKVTPATLKEDGKIVKTCSVCGETKTSVISYPKTIKLSKTEYTYNGKTAKPSVTVTDANGKKISSSNYSVKYSKGCCDAGTYKVSITFKGNYSGKTTKSFVIHKAAQKIKVSNVTKTYGASSFSCGAKVTQGKGALSYKSSNTKIASISSKGKISVKGNGKAKITVTAAETANYKKGSASFYVTVNPKKAALSSVQSPKNGVIKVAWEKVPDVTGYQIRYSKNSDMDDAKTVTADNSKAKSKSISGLSKGKKYYVQVRAYKKSGDHTYKGSWSSKKAVTTLNVKLNKTSVTLTKGKSMQLSISGTKSKVSWSSSKTSVATVSKSGKVTAKAAGKATITAKVGGNSYTCAVTVKAAKKSEGDKVLITKTGKCYHNHKCGNGTYYETTLEDAKKRGLRPCKKCYK